MITKVVGIPRIVPLLKLFQVLRGINLYRELKAIGFKTLSIENTKYNYNYNDFHSGCVPVAADNSREKNYVKIEGETVLRGKPFKISKPPKATSYNSYIPQGIMEFLFTYYGTEDLAEINKKLGGPKIVLPPSQPILHSIWRGYIVIPF